MAQPYVGEIRMFGGNFAPAGWMFCAGQLIPISENETLFNLIGTTYGGDGQSTFALPDLQGRAPMHQGTFGGNSVIIGEQAGVESVTLTVNQIPQHTHAMNAAGAASSLTPQTNLLAVAASTTVNGLQTYAAPGALATLSPSMLQANVGSQPHDNMQPYLCVSFIISLFGIFPTPN